MSRSPDAERAGLSEFLDMQREALIAKVQDLSEEDARRAATVSALSLLSLIKHSAIWERRWFQVIVAGRHFPDEWPEVQSEGVDATIRLTDAETVETVVAYYRQQIAASQEVLASLDLDRRRGQGWLFQFNPQTGRRDRLVRHVPRHDGQGGLGWPKRQPVPRQRGRLPRRATCPRRGSSPPPGLMVVQVKRTV